MDGEHENDTLEMVVSDTKEEVMEDRCKVRAA